MITAALSDTHLYNHLLAKPVWNDSFCWLRENKGTTTEGIHAISPHATSNWFANVHGYATRPAETCIWENHRHTVDIQYIIEGTEGIDWTTTSHLASPSTYKAEFDREEFEAPTNATSRLKLTAGDFVVFMPGEAHRPMTQWDTPVQLRKIVVKIPMELLQSCS